LLWIFLTEWGELHLVKLNTGTKHSSCSQLFNEYEYGINMVRLATDHARMKSVKKYAKVVLPARKTLLKKRSCTCLNPRTKLHDRERSNTYDFNDNWRKCMGIEPTHQLVTGALVLKTRRPTRTLALPC
jgi:hypothetical protein